MLETLRIPLLLALAALLFLQVLDPVALGNLTTALLSLGRFEGAEPLCERMVRLAPSDPEQLAKLAWARWEVGREADAIAT